MDPPGPAGQGTVKQVQQQPEAGEQRNEQQHARNGG